MNSKTTFIALHNVDAIGKFVTNYASTENDKYSLRHVYKIEGDLRDVGNHVIISGFADKDFSFFECPICVGYVQLYRIFLQKKSSYEISLETKVRVFNKDFSAFRLVDIRYTNLRVSFETVTNIVNVINSLIHSGKDINSINYKLIVEEKGWIKPDKSGIIKSCVYSLNFKFYNCCQRRIGKDDIYWDEIEVYNLPNNKYMLQLLTESLSNQCSSISVNESTAILKLNFDHAWCESAPPRVEVKKFSSKHITDQLLMDIATTFKHDEYINNMCII